MTAPEKTCQYCAEAAGKKPDWNQHRICDEHRKVAVCPDCDPEAAKTYKLWRYCVTHSEQHKHGAEVAKRLAYPRVDAEALAMAVQQTRFDHEAAQALLRESLAMSRRLYGDLHPEVAASLSNLANVARLRGDYAVASARLAEVVEMDRRLLGPDHLEVAHDLNALGDSLRLGGDARRAEEVLRESLAIQARVLPSNHWQIASTRTMVALCLVDRRRFAEAERLTLEAYPIVEKEFGPGHRRVAVVVERLVALYEAWGKPERAGEWKAKLEPQTPR
jgi:tetratricopeptide (TPR) repeat protein